MTDMIMFDPNNNSNLPAHLQGANFGVNAALLATMGASGNRIGLKGSRFRLVVNGKEESVQDENYLDVIIVGVVPNISRMYYAGTYDKETKSAPTCFSQDGVAPPVDLATRQSDKCETCQWNVKGSKVVDGFKMKACGFFQRLVVMLPGDTSGMYFKLDVKSQGIFGESHAKQNKFNIRDYAKFISNRGVDAASLITRLSFDTDASTPKLLFSPVGYIAAGDYNNVVAAVASEEVKNLLKISMGTVDLSSEEEIDREVTPVVAASTNTVVAVAEEVDETPVAPVVVPKPPVAEEGLKKQYKANKEKLGDFTVNDYLAQGWTAEAMVEAGYISEVIAEPVKAVVPPAPAKPAAPPAPPKPAAPPAPPKPAAPPAAPVVVESVAIPPKAAKPAAPMHEVGDDDELKALLADLI